MTEMAVVEHQADRARLHAVAGNLSFGIQFVLLSAVIGVAGLLLNLAGEGNDLALIVGLLSGVIAVIGGLTYLVGMLRCLALGAGGARGLVVLSLFAYFAALAVPVASQMMPGLRSDTREAMLFVSGAPLAQIGLVLFLMALRRQAAALDLAAWGRSAQRLVIAAAVVAGLSWLVLILAIAETQFHMGIELLLMVTDLALFSAGIGGLVVAIWYLVSLRELRAAAEPRDD